MTNQLTEQQHKFSGWLLFKNAVSSMAGTFLVSFIGFFITPFLIHHLGNDRFGVWTLLFSIVAVTELADFGIGLGVQRYVAKYVAKNEFEHIKEVVNQAFTIVLMIMLVVSIPFLILNFFLPAFFNIPLVYLIEAKWCLGLLIINMIISVPLAIYSGAIGGYQKYDLLNTNWVMYALVRSMVLVGTVYLPFPMIAMAAASLILTTGRAFSLAFIIKQLCPPFNFKLCMPKKTFLSQVLPYGRNIFLISMMWRIIWASDTLLLGIFMGASSITFYTIGARWSEILRVMFSGAVQVCFPAFSYLDTMNDHKNIHRILLHGTRVAVGFSILGASILILLASPIVLFWVGKGYEVSVPIMRWLSLVGIFSSFSFPFEHYLRAVGQLKPLFKAALFNSVFNIAISIFLIKQVGIVGVVWGTLASLIPAVLFLIVPSACKHAGIHFGMFLKQLIIPLLLPIIWVFGLGIWFHFYPPHLEIFSRSVFWAFIIAGGYMILWAIFDPFPRKLFKAVKFPKAQY